MQVNNILILHLIDSSVMGIAYNGCFFFLIWRLRVDCERTTGLQL
jgi:hypothetical protein